MIKTILHWHLIKIILKILIITIQIHTYSIEKYNLTISAKSNVGIVGTTGCGKTTTVIILGLLEAEGNIRSRRSRYNKQVLDLGNTQLAMYLKIYIFR